MEKQINLIAFLSKVVSQNTQNYRKDFELDAQKLRYFLFHVPAKRNMVRFGTGCPPARQRRL